MSEGMVTDPPMRKGLGSDSARIQRAPLMARAMRRPELGALSGVILIYVVFYAVARNSVISVGSQSSGSSPLGGSSTPL